MSWSEGFIAVDWGTTNRRAYLVDQAGRLADEMEDGKGILSVPSGGFPQAVEEIRSRLGTHPMMLAGMVGSNRGWIEAPYVDCPAGADNLAASVQWAEAGRCAIVPGVCDRRGETADVMRGEEVQVVGAVAAGLIAGDSYLCHPGTHNKWVRLRAGRIDSFRTVMTGELFSLLKKHSILADLLASEASIDDNFEHGVRRGLGGDDLLAELFSIRARVLLGKAQASSAASFASGLLIGSDLRLGLRDAQEEEEIVVMGRPELTGLFAAAVKIAGRKAREVDGEEAFLAGARHLAELVQ